MKKYENMKFFRKYVIYGILSKNAFFASEYFNKHTSALSLDIVDLFIYYVLYFFRIIYLSTYFLYLGLFVLHISGIIYLHN